MIRNLVKSVDKLTGGRLTNSLHRVIMGMDLLPPSTCPCCGYHGLFGHDGMPARIGVRCPSCQSLDRHRLLTLAMQRGLVTIKGRSVLHFAPEAFISKILEAEQPSSYRTSNYPDLDGADLRLNIEAIDLPDGSIDVVVCSHVLEHVDDRKALGEIHRILSPGGLLVAMVPIIEGWEKTYENPAVNDDEGRTYYFGQKDHIRYYGADFRDRIRAAGFTLDEFTASGEDSPKYRLSRGMKVFLGHK